MATITINTNTVTHTLSNRIFGTYISTGYFYDDLLNSTFQSLFTALGVEVLGVRCDYSALTYTGWARCKSFCVATNPPEVSIQVPMAPDFPLPGGTNPLDVNDFEAADSGYSPTAVANFYADWVASGINVIGVELGNEPAFLGTNLRAAELPSPGYFPPTVPNVPWSIAWHDSHYSNWATAVRSKATALGRSVKVQAPAQGSLRPDGYDYTISFIDGHATGGYGATSSNAANVDALAVHSEYGCQMGSNQGSLNSFFNTGTVTNWATSQNTQNMTGVRTSMNANGMSSHPIYVTEGSFADAQTPKSPAAVTGDAAIAISICKGNLPIAAGGTGWDVQMMIFTSYNRGLATNDASLFWADPAVPNHRYFGLRDIIGPFFKNYKRQVTIAVTGSATSPTVVNQGITSVGVPRIQAVAGLNTDGSRLGVLVANIDLTNPSSESITVNYGTTAQGQITGTYCPQNQSNTAMPSIAPFSAGTSFTATLQGGEVYLFVIPLTAGSAPPPDITNTGNYTADLQINASGVGPAPPPNDQNLGNWSIPDYINALVPSTPGPPTVGVPGNYHNRDVEYGGDALDDTTTPVSDSPVKNRNPAWSD